MLCINPYRRGQQEFGCGQCICCRINRKRMWTARIQLEAACYDASTFVTLTYEDSSLPAFGSLSREHWRHFSKGIGFRYFGVGEYGSRTWRAHYHAILFGIDAASAESLVSERWPFGFVQVSPFTEAHAGYVAGYVTKKLTKVTEDLPVGCIPEFSRMSRRPGIGVPGLERVYEWLYSEEGSRYVAVTRDVPKVCRVGGRIYPLGRTLALALRNELGLASSDPLRVVPVMPDRPLNTRIAHHERARSIQRRAKGVL